LAAVRSSKWSRSGASSLVRRSPVSGSRINPQRVKIYRNYTARRLADCLGIHKNTVRHWHRNGLSPIDGRRPYLFNGAVVRAFLIQRSARRKRPCPTGMLFCFRCREPRKPIVTSVEYLQQGTRAGNLRAPCCDCGTIMHRRVRQSEIHSVVPGLLVQITEAPPRLSEKLASSPNCALRTERV
jgi:hypothetical protein